MSADVTADVALFLSSGWVSIAAVAGDEVTVRAYTPGGRGLTLRTPALLPYGVQLRGSYAGRGAYHIANPLPQAVNAAYALTYEVVDDGAVTQREGDVLATNDAVEDSAEAGCGDRGQRRPCNLQTPSGSSSQRLTSSPGG